MSTTPRCILPFLAVVVGFGIAAPETSARDAVNQAVKKVEKDTKAALKVLDEVIEALHEQLDAALHIIDLDVKNGGGALSDAALAFNALKTFQIGIGSAMDDASAALQISQAAAGVLDDPYLPATKLPKGLSYGDGGLCDDYRDAVLKKVDKAVAAAEKRMRKTAGLFEEHADIGFLLRLERPRTFSERAGPIATSFTVVEHSFAILMSASRLEVRQENRLFAFGICHSSDDLELRILSSVVPSSSSPVSVIGNTWEKMFVDVVPGHYVLRIHHDSVEGGGAYGAINVR